ncbi:Ribonuclease H [Abeliophyllum distichum]|uniref:Ribonuclease H n=1 Tax=Abeliophyllum distichum TaxID=126358 RepID=A0ABD1TG77_9LAMI
MEKYDGSSNPVDHLRAFIDLMRLRAIPDAIMCRTFSPTLRREARDWVAIIPPKSICTFDDFSKKFAAYFASSKCAKKTAIGLMQLTQDKDELLKDFIDQFNRATLEIKDLHMSVVVTAMMNRNSQSPFQNEVTLIQHWKNYARGNRSTSVDKNERFSHNITFNDEDLEGVTSPHDDALVIVVDITDFDVKRVLVDNGSAADVMSWEVFPRIEDIT